jgi:hypothetical protein
MTRMAPRDLVIGSIALFLALAAATTVAAQPRRSSPEGGTSVAAATSRGPVAHAPASDVGAEATMTVPIGAWSQARAIATPLIIAAAFGIILALACWQPTDPTRARIPRRRRRL